MRSARYREQREGIWRRRFRVIGAVTLVSIVGFVGWAKLEWTRPDAELLHPIAALGRTSTIDVRLHDAKTGLARSRIEIESGSGPIPVLNPGSSGYVLDRKRGRTAHLNVYEADRSGLHAVRRLAWNGARFEDEPGGAYASGG